MSHQISCHVNTIPVDNIYKNYIGFCSNVGVVGVRYIYSNNNNVINYYVLL
jgi:hypothetical protein